MRDITCEHAVLGIPSDFSGMYCLNRPPSVRLTKWAISVPDACNSAPGGGRQTVALCGIICCHSKNVRCVPFSYRNLGRMSKSNLMVIRAPAVIAVMYMLQRATSS